MASCTFTNLTKEQANALADWMCDSGEQDAYEYFFVNNDTPFVVDVSVGKKKWKTIDKNGNVTVQCKSVETIDYDD